MLLHELPDHARNAFYVTVGLGVIAVQNLHDRQTAFTELIKQRMSGAQDRLAGVSPISVPFVSPR